MKAITSEREATKKQIWELNQEKEKQAAEAKRNIEELEEKLAEAANTAKKNRGKTKRATNRN